MGQLEMSSSEPTTTCVDESPSPQPTAESDKKDEVPSPTGDKPLHCKWTFWFSKKPKSGVAYSDSLINIGSFDSVAGFWAYYSNLVRPSQLSKDPNYSLFRNDSPPMWEHYKKGGCWNLHIKKNCGRLCQLWEQVVLAAIGEMFEHPSVVGVVVSVRSKEDVLSVWIDDASNALQFVISEKLKEIWKLNHSTRVEFKKHSSSLKDRSTYRNGKFYSIA